MCKELNNHMAAPTPTPATARPQSVFFYTSTWTPAVDKCFIDALVVEAVSKSKILSSSDTSSIRYAHMRVNERFNTNFTCRQCFEKFRKLQERYLVFDFITCLSSVYYDETNNVVHVFENFIWEYVYLKYKLAEAYMIQGEPQWDALCKIFGPRPVHSPPRPVEIVDLTSDSDGSIAIPVDAIQIPRETFEMNNSDFTNSWWDNLVDASYDQFSENSSDTDNSYNANDPSTGHVKQPLNPRCLFPIPEQTIYVPDGGGIGKPLDDYLAKPLDDYHCSSSQGSSSSVNGPPPSKAKSGKFFPKGLGRFGF